MILGYNRLAFKPTKACAEGVRLNTLVRPTAHVPLTYSRVAKLFPPKFSEIGSNRRLKEEVAFRFFLNYLEEVAGTVECIILLYNSQMRSKHSL